MPWANFLIMTAARPAHNPVGMLRRIMKTLSDILAILHALNCSIHVFIFSLSTVLVFQAAKLGKSVFT